jgi:hypothetical protein
MHRGRWKGKNIYFLQPILAVVSLVRMVNETYFLARCQANNYLLTGWGFGTTIDIFLATNS